MASSEIARGGVAPWWRRLLVALVPITAAGGPYLFPLPVAGITLYAFRFVLLAAVPLFWLLERGAIRGERRIVRAGFACGALWVAWGLASLAWAHDTSAAVVDVVAVGLGWLAIFVLVQGVGRSESMLKALRRGWVGAFVVAVAVAAWELRTGQHLESSISDQLGPGTIGNLIIFSTFGNPNNFAAFLLLVVPVILWDATETRSWVARGVLLACLPVAAGLSILAGARLAMIGFVFETMILVLTLGLRRKYRRRLLLGLGASIVALGVLLVEVPAAARDVAGLWTLADELQYSGSASIRWNMIRSGFLMVEETGGVGVGAGNFPDAVRRGSSIGYTGGIVNPHNLGMEIASQYGLIVAAAFGGFILMLAARAVRDWLWARRLHDRKREMQMAMLLSVLVGYFFAAAENSAYINQPVHWAMLGTIVVMLTGRGDRPGAAGAPVPSNEKGVQT